MKRYGTLQFDAIDVAFVLVVNDGKYKKLLTSDNKEFDYWLNPAAYGAVNAVVRWDALTNSWVQVEPAHLLDDRYTVGADYLTKFGQKAPIGSTINSSDIKRDSSGNFVSAVPAALTLQNVYSDAAIYPLLVLKAYEERLASHDLYTYMGMELSSYTVAGENALLNSILNGEKETAINTLLVEWVSRLKNNHPNVSLRYDLHKFLGSKFTEWASSISVNGTTVLINSSLFYSDGTEVGGEFFTGLSTGSLAKPTILLPGIKRVVGTEINGVKGVRGAYTFTRPERVYQLGKIVADEVSALLATLTEFGADVTAVAKYTTNQSLTATPSGANVGDVVLLMGQTNAAENGVYTVNSGGGLTLHPASKVGNTVKVTTPTVETFVLQYASRTLGTVAVVPLKDAAQRQLSKELGYNWYDWFKGSDVEVEVPVSFDVDGNVTGVKKVRANVFVGFMGSSQAAAQIAYRDDAGNVVKVSGRAINLGDTFSYASETAEKARPFPAAYQFITGPYGSIALIDQDGKLVGYSNDAYGI